MTVGLELLPLRNPSLRYSINNLLRLLDADSCLNYFTVPVGALGLGEIHLFIIGLIIFVFAC